MGQQSGASGGKGKSPPNPNNGSGNGVDNSNGVYNAGQTSAASSGIPPMSGSTNPAATTGMSPAVMPHTSAQSAYGGGGKGTGGKGANPQQPQGTATPTTPAHSTYATVMGAALGNPADAVGTGDNPADGGMIGGNMANPDGSMKNPQPYVDPNVKQGRGTIAPLPGRRVPPEQQGQPMDYNTWLKSQPPGTPIAGMDYTNYVDGFKHANDPPLNKDGTPRGPLPAQGTLPPGGPLGGLSQKLQAKGGSPAAPQGPQNGLPDWLQKLTNGQTPNGQAAPTGAAAGEPAWLDKFRTGTDLFGQDLKARGDATIANKWGAEQNLGRQYFEQAHPGEKLTNDWRSLMQKITGDSTTDPVQMLMQARQLPGNQGANMRRVLENSGLDKHTGALLENAFGAGGADSEQAAHALGIGKEYYANNGFKAMPKGYETAVTPDGKKIIYSRDGKYSNTPGYSFQNGQLMGPDGPVQAMSAEALTKQFKDQRAAAAAERAQAHG